MVLLSAPSGFGAETVAEPWLATRLSRLVEQRSTGSLAMMLYGSRARLTATACSDVDVLELVSSAPRPVERDGINITQYRPSHLNAMARAGSLFVLHLRLEGKILFDPEGSLYKSLTQYRHPQSYSALKKHLHLLAAATDLSALEFRKYGRGIFALGVFIIRTLAYIECAESGVPKFDMTAAAKHLDKEHLVQVGTMKRNANPSFSDLALLRNILTSEIGSGCLNPCSSLETYAIEIADYRYASSLLAAAITDAGCLAYEAMVPPPHDHE